MPDYDRQVIAQFLCGDPGDKLIRDNAEAINDYAKRRGLKSHRFTVPISGQSQTLNDKRWTRGADECAKLTAESRVYMQGHGDWKQQKLGDWGPVESADLLVALGMKAAKVISILGCSLGSDRTAPDNVRVLNSADSYASRFHKALKTRHGIETVVYARIWDVVPIGPLAKQVLGLEDEWLGRKTQNVDNIDGNFVHRAGNTKIRFFWRGNSQGREWAY